MKAPSMKSVLYALLGAGVALCALVVADAAQDAIKIVGVRQGAIVVQEAGGGVRDLVAGGPPRGLPVWSQDGRRIAFVQFVDRDRALADLVVVSDDGREQARVAIEPVTAEFGSAGMRYVEGVQWISPSRVVVHGSLDPSQSQYYVIDIATGQTVADFIDDASGPAFSPDGAHIACRTGSPHWTPAESRAAVLLIDGRPVYPQPARSGVQFAAAPRWSGDSRSVAVVAQDTQASVSRLVVWRDGRLNEQVVDLGVADRVDLAWDGETLYLSAARFDDPKSLRAWAADDEGLTLTPTSSVDARSASSRQVLAMRADLLAAARREGLSNPDVWCDACGLERLPRSSE